MMMKERKKRTQIGAVQSDDKLIRGVYGGLLAVTVIGSVSSMLCVLIDTAITGKFLGTAAMSATGLLTPAVLLTTMLCTIIGLGLATVCTRYMGMAQIERVNQVFSVVFYATLLIGAAVSALMFAFAPVIASVLCRGIGDPEIAGHCIGYLRGFAIGRAFTATVIPLNGIMLLDNDKNRVMAALLVTLVADVILDLANVLVFHGGMFGMALATSISGILEFVVMMLHFRKENRVVRFTRTGLRLSDVKDSLAAGLASSITQIGMVLRGFFFNRILIAFAGAGAVASLAVANSSFAVIMFLYIAVLTATSSLVSMFFGEEDLHAIGKTLRLAIRYTFVISAVLAFVFLIFARPVASAFLSQGATEEIGQAARFIRFMTLQCVLSAINYPFVGGLLGTKQTMLNNLIAIAREIVFPIASALLLGALFGLSGFEAGFVVAGVLVLLLTILVPWIRHRRMPGTAEDFVILSKPFDATEEELFEASVRDMDGVVLVSEQIRSFCTERGADPRTAFCFSLFVEEMAGNAVQHGFRGKRGESVDIRLIYKEDEKVIRLRDNGKLFDPVTWLEQNRPDDPLRGAGIRMIIGMAKDVQYIPALRLNNLIVTV